MVSVAVFCEAPGTGQAAPPEMPGVLTAELWRGQARLYPADCGAAPWFPWAILGLNALPDLAHQAGLRMVGVHRGRHRCFAQLAHHRPDRHAGRGTETPDRRAG